MVLSKWAKISSLIIIAVIVIYFVFHKRKLSTSVNVSPHTFATGKLLDGSVFKALTDGTVIKV